MLAHSEACERNKEPILAVLREAFADCREVIEIGSGTGQHAVHFATQMPWLHWQPTDCPAELAPLAERVRQQGPPNLRPPLARDVTADAWPVLHADAVFSANTLHIMGWPAVEALFAGLPRVLAPDGVLAVYGPFRYRGDYTTASNAAFDQWLKAQDDASGIRDFEAVDDLARRIGLELVADHAMPANNQTLVWRGRASRPQA